MKVYQTLTFLLLINFICSKNYCLNDPPSPSKTEDCSSKKNDGGYCCFVKGRAGNTCGEFGPESYKHIPELVKYYKKCYPKQGDSDDCEEYKDYSIDCNSSYLVFSLLSFLLLFL